MAGIRILVANEPRSYRDVLALALRGLRPCAEVIVGGAADLGTEVALHRPHLVLRSSAESPEGLSSVGWVVLNPGGSASAVVTIGGRRTTIADVNLADLISLVDQTKRLAPPDERTSVPARHVTE